MLDERELGGSARSYIEGRTGCGVKSAAGGVQGIAGRSLVQREVAKGGHAAYRINCFGPAQRRTAGVCEDGYCHRVGGGGYGVAGSVLNLDRHGRRDGLSGNCVARLLDERELGGSAG